MNPANHRGRPLGKIRLLCLMLLSALGCTGGGDPPHPPVSRLPDPFRDGKLVLGAPSLTAGIPGVGPLSLAEIQRHLADPVRHLPLAVTPPLGLHTLADQLQLDPAQPLTRAKIELGRQLFFDRRLSRDRSLACGECHLPALCYTRFVGRGEYLRDPAVSFNRLFSTRQFWDGRAASLEEQPLTPLSGEHELNLPPSEAVARLAAIPGYRLQFERIFGSLDQESLCAALAAFVRVLATGPAPYDFQRTREQLSARDPATLSQGERDLLAEAEAGAAAQPLSPEALRGAVLFFGDRCGCSRCHREPTFTDEDFHCLGETPPREHYGRMHSDLGRFAVTGEPADRHAFKTPTLRNVSKTAPYLHDGRFDALEQLLAWKMRGGDPGDSSELSPFELTPAEQGDLLAFLHSLNSPLPPVETGRLPAD